MRLNPRENSAIQTYSAVLVTDDRDWARELSTAMAPIEDIRLLRVLDSKGLRQFLLTREPAVVMLDMMCEGAAAVWQSAIANSLPMIAFGNPEDAALVRAALHLGALDYLAKNANLRDIAEGIYRAGGELARLAASAIGSAAVHGKIIAVASLRGGSGRSTVAVNTAAALQQRSSKPVGLWDLNFTMGAADTLLSVRTPRPLADLMAQLQRLDPEFFLTFFAKHRSGLRVLPVPGADSGGPLAISTANMQSFIGAMRSTFAFTVVDTSTAFTEPDFAVIEAADLVLLVVTPDMLAIKAALLYLDEMQTSHVVRSKHVLVLNGFGRGDVRRKDAEGTLSLPVWGQVPFDRAAFLRALNLGEPVVTRAPRSRAAASFSALAARIMSMEVAAK